jgi:hypothetical protein
MSKQVKILVILVIAALAVYFLYTSKPWKSLKHADETAFAIEDTASITKVFIADGRGSNTLLEQQPDGSWMINGKFLADENKVNLLLQTIHDVKLRNPVGQAEFNNVLKSFTAGGVKVEIYNNDDLVKTMYVGQMTSDQTGTYMMIEGASAPYVTHIPGFVGYLSPRFLPQAVKWRSRIIFHANPDDITRISVNYPGESQQSFVVENATGVPVLKNSSGAVINVADSVFLKYYLASFNGLYGEGFDELFDRARQDSIAKTPAFCTISVETKQGRQQSVQLHIKKIERGTKERYTEGGKELEYDSERFYAFANGSPDMMYVQQYGFGKVMRKLGDFMKK